jgi:hypothetical protein
MAEIIQFPGKKEPQVKKTPDIPDPYKFDQSEDCPLSALEVMEIGKIYSDFIKKLTVIAVSNRFDYTIENTKMEKYLKIDGTGYVINVLFEIPNMEIPMDIDERKLSIRHYAEILKFRAETGKLKLIGQDIVSIIDHKILSMPITAVWHYINKPDFKQGEDLKETIFNILGY